MALDRAVGVEVQDPHRSTVHTAIVIMRSAHHELGDAVPIQVVDPHHAVPEAITRAQHAGEPSYALGNAHLIEHRPRSGAGRLGRRCRSAQDHRQAREGSQKTSLHVHGDIS